jgi:hypothetical protein
MGRRLQHFLMEPDSNYLAVTLDVIDVMTVDAILN